MTTRNVWLLTPDTALPKKGGHLELNEHIKHLNNLYEDRVKVGIKAVNAGAFSGEQQEAYLEEIYHLYFTHRQALLRSHDCFDCTPTHFRKRFV